MEWEIKREQLEQTSMSDLCRAFANIASVARLRLDDGVFESAWQASIGQLISSKQFRLSTDSTSYIFGLESGSAAIAQFVSNLNDTDLNRWYAHNGSLIGKYELSRLLPWFVGFKASSRERVIEILKVEAELSRASEVPSACRVCGGSGREGCYVCDGRGEYQTRYSSWIRCGQCQGSGSTKCLRCGGHG